MLGVCISYDGLRGYHVTGQLWNEPAYELQLRTNVQQCLLFALPEEGISANLEGAANYECWQPGDAQVVQIACSRLWQARGEKPGEEKGDMIFPVSC